jgi:hypothetical protein
MFAHHEEEDKIYSLTLTKIADAQHKDQELKVYYKKNTKMPQKHIGLQLIEDTNVARIECPNANETKVVLINKFLMVVSFAQV